MNTKLIFLLLLSVSFLGIQAQNMSNKKLHKILEGEAEKIEGKMGLWTVTYGELPLLVITDEKANRMRIFTFVTEETTLEANHIKSMLKANFHSALDAKYALSDGFVISVFTHPLKELTKAQAIDALKQVVTLAYTFGTTYTSTGWVFGSGIEEEKEQKKTNQKKAEKKL